MSDTNIIPQEIIENKIYLIRDKKVMIDRDLAKLYGVETKVFNLAVKRHIKRFPDDFMFQLTKDEFDNLRSQIETSRWGGRRYLPYVFTEQGVAMLSSIINSDRAIEVNIQIIRAFIKLREMLSTHEELRLRIEDMEKKYDSQFNDVFQAIKQLIELTIEPEKKPKKEIGFQRE